VVSSDFFSRCFSSLSRPVRQVVLLCLIVPAVLQGCRQGAEQPPVPEEKMQDILLDIHLAEAYSQGLGDSARNRFEKNYDSLASFYTSILKHHSLSFEAFNEALEWYKERPASIDTLYHKVLNRLNELKAREGISDADPQPEGKPPGQAADSGRHAADTLPGSRNQLLLKDTAAKKP